MKVGIVGSEEKKFTSAGEVEAKRIIRAILVQSDVTEVVSGRCPLGGVDIWAVEIGRILHLKVTEFPPVSNSWEDGFKPRNLKIANYSDVVHCITVSRLPKDFRGRRFDLCYHCKTDTHVKSGGCWTMKKARKGVLHVVKQ